MIRYIRYVIELSKECINSNISCIMIYICKAMLNDKAV